MECGNGVSKGLVMEPSKHQRSNQTCQDLCWKVHSLTQSSVLRSYIHDAMYCLTKTLPLASSSVRSKQLLCLVHGSMPKSEQKHTTKNFVEFRNHFPFLNYGYVHRILKSILIDRRLQAHHSSPQLFSDRDIFIGKGGERI